MKNLICPRCKNNKFEEVDCGPDSYDDDIFYTSYICKKCRLWFDGWIKKWLINCDIWQDADICEEYITKKKLNKQVNKMIKRYCKYTLIESKTGEVAYIEDIKKVILNLKRYDPDDDYFGVTMCETNTGDYIKFDNIINLFL